MLVREYKDFDELFYELNREVILNPNKLIKYQQAAMGFQDNVLITCHNWDCHLDLGRFGYGIGKWKHLLKTYIDYDTYMEFRQKVAESTGLSLTFYFKQKKVHNGSCLIALVLSRTDRHKPWGQVNVIWRTTETQRRLSADLVLINRFITELPGNCKIQKVVLYMVQLYTSAAFVNGYLEFFDIDTRDIDAQDSWGWFVLRMNERYFKPGGKKCKFASLRRMQDFYLSGSNYTPVPCESLSIRKFFEGGTK